jgi:hypothetical protein
MFFGSSSNGSILLTGTVILLELWEADQRVRWTGCMVIRVKGFQMQTLGTAYSNVNVKNHGLWSSTMAIGSRRMGVSV